MPSHPFYKNNRGMSLIELMVALVLGLLITAGVIQLFVGSKMSYQSSEAMARVQESGRFAMELLKPTLRQSGSHGFCAANLEINNHLNTGCEAYQDAIFDPNRVITGYEFNGTGVGDDYSIPADLDPEGVAAGNWSSLQPDGTTLSLPSALQDRVVPGSDVLIVRRLDILADVTAENTNNNSIVLNQDHGAPNDSIILVTNCVSAADLFQNTNAAQGNNFNLGGGSCTNPGPGNQTPGGGGLNWSTSYDDTMQAFRTRIFAYYAGFNAERGEPGLYRLELSTGTQDSALQPEELVEGVETLQVEYGYSAPAFAGGDGQSISEWIPAGEVDDWDLVVAVRLGVLARSTENVDGSELASTHALNAVNVTHTADQRLRQPFTATVAMRNRLIVK